MMRVQVLPLAAILVVVVAGCASTPAGPPAGAASPETSPTPTPVPPFDGPVLTLVAKAQEFQQTELTALAGTPFRIMFENADTNLAHNVTIMPVGVERPVGEDVPGFLFKGEIIHGGTRAYDVPALATGMYQFFCLPHANMNGILTIE